jgi:hypothetical protein
MLSNDIKKELREYFNIKNISAAKSKHGFWDVNLYYDALLLRKNAIENEKKLLEEKQQEEEKRRMRNKLKKLRKKINKQAKQFSSDEDTDNDDEVEPKVKPYIFFIPQLQPLFKENLNLIGLLNKYYEDNENYRKYLLDNEFEKIKITRQLHTGYTDPLHFNGYFLTRDDSKMSGCIHFYVEDGVIKKLSMIMEIF